METGEVIDRVMTDAEHIEWQAQQAEAEAQAEAADERLAHRKAVLDKLGLTANEAAALLG